MDCNGCFPEIKELTRAILKNAAHYDWSLQGFGMLRLHLSDAVRLNVWDSRYQVPNVSMMHTHPWDFESTVIVGELRNNRYVKDRHGDLFECAEIKPGPGGGIRNSLGNVGLHRRPVEIYISGEAYRQSHDEIHISLPADGTVTLNRRKRVGDDIAQVFWPLGQEWVSAEPRPALPEEVADIAAAALRLF